MGWWWLPGPGEKLFRNEGPTARAAEIFLSQALWSEEKHGVVEAAWPGRNYSEMKTQQPVQRRNFFPMPCGVRRNMGW